MPARKRIRTRARTAAGARRGRPRPAKAGRRSVRLELHDVLKAQAESGLELQKTQVPIDTEPAAVFKV